MNQILHAVSSPFFHRRPSTRDAVRSVPATACPERGGARFRRWIGRGMRLPLLLLALSTGTAVAAPLETHAPKAMPAVHQAQLRTLLAQSRNRPLILIFWASWCEPCREEMPALQRLSERWRSRGLQVITIAVADQPQAASNFLAKTAASLPLVLDPDQRIAQDWGVYMLPASLLLDRQHRIIGSARGAIEWDTAPIDQQLQSLLQRK